MHFFKEKVRSRRGHREDSVKQRRKIVIYKPKGEVSEETNLASALISGF
jgi:hypothetical protein